jgi:beta-barrel assembly-enhancing protease
MKMTLALLTLTISTLVAVPASAQLGGLKGLGDKLDKAKAAKDTADSLSISDQEEQEIGTEISAKLRDRYGVVQDQAVHKYVSLVGSVLAKDSTRPNLRWTFVVLDTDGVNAFAAPGGYIHVTRGALALIQNEAELADVLGHEISHVTEKHTVNAIEKASRVSLGAKGLAQLSKSEKLGKLAEIGYGTVLENAYDRGDEEAADRIGITLANKSGYAPTGLSAFLTRLSDRNKGLKERSGMFASHPETQGRLDALKKTIASAKLTAAAMVAPRYTAAITYKPVAVTAVAQGDTSTPKSASGGGRLGMGGLKALGNDKDSSVSSGGSRGVNPDRDAKGGPNKSLVNVSVSAAEIATFRKGIAG